MLKKKILYVTTEIDPFLQVSSLALIVRDLAQSMVKEGYEVRVIMPKFGMINERVNRIHEIQRLYGININIEEEFISLIVKVAPINRGKIQVYFIDNEDLFQHKQVFHDENGQFYADNDVRITFMCKAVWAILQNLGWAPDVVHCLGWPWVFVPMYGKLLHQKIALFSKTKFVYTYGPKCFPQEFGNRIIQKAMMRRLKKEDFLALGEKAGFSGFLALAKNYSDQVTYSFQEDEPLALETIKKLGATCVPPDDTLIPYYSQLYEELLEDEEDDDF